MSPNEPLKPPNLGKAWSPLDDFYLANGLKARTITKVAEELGRDVAEARVRAIELGIRLDAINSPEM